MARTTNNHSAQKEEALLDEEEPVLGLYFAAEDSILAAQDVECSDPEQEETTSSAKSRKRIHRQSHRVSSEPSIASSSSSPKSPTTVYETSKIPSPSSIIALISQRRLDRLTPAQAQSTQTDTCLPCASSSSSLPGQRLLHTLPCAHKWCTSCLVRAFLFAKTNHTYNRLRCCDPDEDIPLSYFENIAQDRERPPAQWERQDISSPTTSAAATQVPPPISKAKGCGEGQVQIPGLRDWNPVHVVAYVEKDTSETEGAYITTGEIASYKESLLEFNTLPKDRIYCPRSKSCGSFIPPPPKGSRKGKQIATITCPKCNRQVCLRCRKNPSSHMNGGKGAKCTAGKSRMEAVKNNRKLLVLARRKGWKRCPRCRMFVEKVKGNCSSVVCLCGRYFFYG